MKPIKKSISYLQKEKAWIGDKNTQVCLSFLPAEAVIIAPSFGYPCLVHQKEKLEIFLAINESLVENYAFDPALFKRRINLQLHVQKWEKRNTSYANISDPKELGDHFFEHFKDNVQQGMKTSEPVSFLSSKINKIKNQKGVTIGLLEKKMVSLYINAGFTHWVRLRLKHHLSEGMYHLHWTSLERNKNNQYRFKQSEAHLLRKNLEGYGTKQRHAYEFVKEQGKFRFQESTQQELCSYHPLFVLNKKTLGVGHLTDCHVSSRQTLFQQSTMQVAKGLNSPKLGTRVHSCFESCQNILTQFGESKLCDLVFITGDLVDFAKNIDPEFELNKDPKTLWSLLDLKKNKRRNLDVTLQTKTISPKNYFEQTHIPGIDLNLFYSLMLWFYDKYRKPIFLISGNHDYYEEPYGISPRFFQFKANDCVPMDHNLTFYEANLLFGPGYADILSTNNFNTRSADWFYLVFTPLSDFSVHYQSQIFMGLGWGEKESILTNRNQWSQSSTLPQATDGLTEDQIDLMYVNTHTEAFQKKDCYLFMHAPFISYDYKIPLCLGETKEKKIFISDTREPFYYSRFASGSFKKNRDVFFKDFILNHKIAACFSGHSHRGALYVWEEFLKEKAIEVESLILTTPKPQYYKQWISTKGFPLENAQQKKSTNGQTLFIVSSSSGPIGAQNHYHHWFGCGLEAASGTLYSKTKDDVEIKKIITNNTTAKPRLAVLMDYYDRVNKGKSRKGVFKQISTRNSNLSRFFVELDEGLPKVDFFQGLKLVIKEFKQEKIINFMKIDHSHFDLKKEDLAFVREALINGLEIFLAVQFKKNIGSYAFAGYALEDDWIFPVEILNSNSKIVIKRHPKLSEVPNFSRLMTE